MKRPNCRGKRSYTTFEQANNARDRLAQVRQRQGRAHVVETRAYGCSCGAYHVGSARYIQWSKAK